MKGELDIQHWMPITVPLAGAVGISVVTEELVAAKHWNCSHEPMTEVL
jgi:hypothetical protein